MALQSLVERRERQKHAEPARNTAPQPAVMPKSKMENPVQPLAVSSGHRAMNAGPLPDPLKARLRALSALQIRYGRPQEAVPYLALLKHEQPDDAQTSRMLALALMRLGKWKEADTLLEDTGSPANSPITGLMALYRAVVSMKLGSMEKARQWLARFRSASIGRGA